MKHWCVTQPHETSQVPVALVSRLANVVGSDAFVDELLGGLSRAVPLSRCGLFVFDRETRPKRLISATKCESQPTQVEVDRYMKRFYLYDGVRQLMQRPAGHHQLCILDSSDIGQGDWRQGYEAASLVARASLLSADEDGHWVSLNLYRDAVSGPFSGNETDHLMTLAPVLASFVRRHVQLTRPPAGHTVDECRQRLLELCPDLSARELEVCALILKGLTAIEIGQDLAIKPSTVVCYRKRAYARLDVANHRELQARCF